MEFNNFINVGHSTLRQFGTILILWFGDNLFHVITWFVVCYCIDIFTYIISVIHFFPSKVIIPGFSSSVLKRNIKFASDMTLTTIFWTIYRQADKAVISKLMPIGILGYYSFALRAVSIGSSVSNAISQAAFPSFSFLIENDKKTSIQQYKKLQDIICIGNVPILALVAFSAFPVFSYIFNKEIAAMLLLPTVFLCCGSYLYSAYRLPISYAIAMGKTEIPRNTNFFSLFVIIPLTIILIYYWGLTGAALVLICRVTFLYLYAIPKICAECFKFSAVEWYRHLLRIFFLAIISYGGAGFLLDMVRTISVLSLFLMYLMATSCFLIFCYFLIGNDLRESLFNHINLYRSKLAGVFSE
jgi:O-antigen/teichoic acid export membrane protein